MFVNTERQIENAIRALIDSDGELRMFDLNVQCNKWLNDGNEFYRVTISSPDSWRFTFRTWSFDKYPELTAHPRIDNPLHQYRYAINGTTGKLDPTHTFPSVSDAVSHVYPARAYAGKAIRVDVTKQDGERLEVPTVVMIVSSDLATDTCKAELIRYILYALCRTNQIFALY